MNPEEIKQFEELKAKVEKLENSRSVSNPGQLVDWPISSLRVKKLEIVSKGNSLYGVRSDDGFYVGVGDSAVNVITSGRVLHNINSVAQNWIPNADNTYYLGKNSASTPFAWKGLIVKDTTNGNYYRIEVISGTVTATVL